MCRMNNCGDLQFLFFRVILWNRNNISEGEKMRSECTEVIKSRISELQEPENLYEGLRLPEFFALPDNILLFYHDFCAPAPVAHHRYTLVFPLAPMHYYVNEQEFDLDEGDLLFIPPCARRFLAPQSAGYQRFFITFELPREQSYLPRSSFNRLSQENAQIMEEFFDLYSKKDPRGLSLSLYRFLTSLSPGPALHIKPRMSREIATAIAFINNNLHTPLENRSIAAKVNMSTGNLARRFRKETGMALHEYISGQRLEFARCYLQKTCMSVEEIARCCGFLSGSSFSRFFTLRTGSSPLSYRKGACVKDSQK